MCRLRLVVQYMYLQYQYSLMVPLLCNIFAVDPPPPLQVGSAHFCHFVLYISRRAFRAISFALNFRAVRFALYVLRCTFHAVRFALLSIKITDVPPYHTRSLYPTLPSGQTMCGGYSFSLFRNCSGFALLRFKFAYSLSARKNTSAHL